MNTDNARLGIALMSLTMFIFAAQDGISQHLAQAYNVSLVVMIRYWFFAIFVVTITARRAGGLKNAAATRQPWLQAFRGALLAIEVNVMVFAFTQIGLVASHAIFAAYPLIVAALSGPVLGERVGWRRWLAIAAGFVGVLVILRPGLAVFQPGSAIALTSATLFALYALLTRFAARQDSAATSFFWTGTVGALVATIIGAWYWEPMALNDWGWMLALCVSGAIGHYLLIRTYEVAETSTVQPFAYLQLIFASAIGLIVFREPLATNIVIGAAIIVGAGLFTLWREKLVTRT
ncbi:MAG: DMT family transporter [Pseudomonadota bacterium]